MPEGHKGLLRESAREMVVVVLSILIAFGLDAWWESARERRDERELLSNLLVEFRANQAQLDLRIDNHERLAGSSGELAALLSASTAGTITVPDSLLFSLFVTPTFNPTLGTLGEAQSSGRTGLIENAELRALLGAWPGMWADAREEERLGMELVQQEFYPALARTTVVADLMSHGGAWLARRTPEPVLAARRSLPATPALTNYTKQRWVRSRRAAEELSALRSHLAEIVEMLERELG